MLKTASRWAIGAGKVGCWLLLAASFGAGCTGSELPEPTSTGGVATGGNATSGGVPAGGTLAGGGSPETGGGGSPGTGGASMGGQPSGGTATGGAVTASGGTATGGAVTASGGTATGGAVTASGGTATGGTATGGTASGGKASGGRATGGKASGGTSAGGAATGGAGGAGGCTPNYSCTPTAPNTGDPYADCVARINQFRACVCVPALTRNSAAEACANQMAQYDYEHNTAHAGFSANICSPRGNGQNECPGWPSIQSTIDGCAQQMYNEGPGTDFNTHGHFINMTNTSYHSMACGFYTTPSGQVWTVQNYFP